MKNSTLIPALALVAAMLTQGCSRSASPDADAGTPGLVAQAIETNVPVQIDPAPVGHVRPYSTVTIRPQIGGVLSAIHFQEGQEV
jgi:multidrug efflux pump subunit AcrA (membrane-fusion protein)